VTTRRPDVTGVAAPQVSPEASSQTSLRAADNILWAESLEEPAPPPGILREIFKKELLDHGPAIYVGDTNGTIIWANLGFRRLVAAMGEPKSADALLPTDKIAAEVLLLESMVFREDTVTIGKTVQHLRSRHLPLHDEVGRIVAIAGIIQTAPEDSQQIETLSRTRERLDDITRLVSDWIWETDTKLTLTSVSHRVMEVLGFHPRELIGRNFLSLSGSGTSHSTIEQRFAQQSPFRDLPFEALTRTGESKLFLLNAVPVFCSKSGALIGFRGTASDITELRKRELGLRTAKDMAEMASRAKTEFLANMSHELRTPLNAIIGFSEIMQMELLGPVGTRQYHEYVGDIHDSARHLLEVINDILDVSKIEAGKANLIEQEVDVLRIFESVLRLIRERATRAEVELVSAVASDVPLLRADDRKLKQVLINLLSNAVKFTPTGGRIELSARLDQNGDLLMAVADTGIGIGPGDLERVMEPFGQVDSRLNRKYDGTGLGLPLTQGLVSLHGGSIDLKSELGAGTTVTVRLPAERLIRG
jgi:PAS domain S-box-containing protein